MNIPEKVKILGHTYSVKEVTWVCREFLNGTCDYSKLEIEIDKDLPESRKHEIFLHEVLEALDYHLELKLEHKILSSLSEGLYAVLSEIKPKENK